MISNQVGTKLKQQISNEFIIDYYKPGWHKTTTTNEFTIDDFKPSWNDTL